MSTFTINQYSLNQYSRFSDSVERSLMRDALSCGEAVSLKELASSVYSGVKKAVVATAHFIEEVNRALNEARAKDSRFSGSNW